MRNSGQKANKETPKANLNQKKTINNFTILMDEGAKTQPNELEDIKTK